MADLFTMRSMQTPIDPLWLSPQDLLVGMVWMSNLRSQAILD